MNRNHRIHIGLLVPFFLLSLLVFSCQEGTAPAGPDPDPDPGPDPTEQDTAVSDTLDPGIDDDYSDISHISNFEKWGTHNVHDPSIIKAGDTYYMYSTDVFYGGGGVPEDDPRRQPKIPIRRSKDLVHWEPVGHVFAEMPRGVTTFIRQYQPSYYPVSVWAPFIIRVQDQYRLYYSVPANEGMHLAYLGLAVSDDPEGPWRHQGLVLPTFTDSPYNGIDPAVSVDRDTGRHWLIYGSWDNGIHAVELDPETGFRLDEQDTGTIIASRRLEFGAAPLEGAEVQYNPEQDKYYLFVSYDPLIETYNVRVGRADQPQGPYYDFFGRNMAETTDNYPKITAQYQFNGHPGWQGVGHTGILKDDNTYYLASQGRLGSDIHLMNLHLRRMFWTRDGWPSLSPQRYANIPQMDLTDEDMHGEWEFIYLDWTDSKNQPQVITLQEGGTTEGNGQGSWELSGAEDRLRLETGGQVFEGAVFRGWDWENDRVCLLFTGLDSEGISGWAKKLDD